MGKSSKDKRDAYYRLAKEQNWRARSAFKLIQIDEAFDLFAHSQPESVTRVVDLCAAPGSWSQVLSRVLIRGESFGRRAWEEKRSRERKELESQTQTRTQTYCNESRDMKLSEDGDKKRIDDGDDDKNNGNGSATDSATFAAVYGKETTVLKPRNNVKIVSIDLQPMAPLEGITTLKADITHPSTVPLLLRALDPEKYDSGADETHPCDRRHPVDLVLSDGAPDVTGLHDLDIYIQSQLLYAALNLAIQVLRPGGKFVAKIFRGRDVDLLYAQLKTIFQHVSVAKPRSSRASSLEAFVVCEGFMPPKDVAMMSSSSSSSPFLGNAVFPLPNIITASVTVDAEVELEAETDAINRWVPAFIACGDLSAWDADASYELPAEHISLDPVQPPTAPPYRRALEIRRAESGAFGKTKKTLV